MSDKDKLKTNNEKITINDYYYYYLLKCEDTLNELEKWLIEHIDEYRDMEQDAMFEFGLVLDKLKELKENNK